MTGMYVWMYVCIFSSKSIVFSGDLNKFMIGGVIHM